MTVFVIKDVRLFFSVVFIEPLRERGNPLPLLHGLLFLINSKESFICTFPQTE